MEGETERRDRRIGRETRMDDWRREKEREGQERWDWDDGEGG